MPVRSLRSKITKSKTLAPKLAVLDSDLRVRAFFESRKKSLARLFAALKLGSCELFLFKCLVAVGQQHVLSSGMEFTESEELQSSRGSVKKALWALVEMIESFDLSGDDDFPHLDIINDLLDDERAIGKGIGQNGALQSLNDGPHTLNRQFSFPSEIGLSSTMSSSTSNSCRFERTRGYQMGGFHHGYSSPGTYFDTVREYVPQASLLSYVNGQIDGLIQETA
ncbi:hypothetical protein K2173_019179 [Erythroxylum novogranatense]|uniref:Uncharacterized protein n=1 Tax=Erythroxylum novogranatense TaxID=1862640 RepID=A0AAV8SSX1_9ROSI|nr:hypothetical protein K2173_019179 [Erythroxylum novogranatense]